MVRTIELPASTTPRQVDAYLRLIAATVDAWGEATGDNVSVGGVVHTHPDGAGVLSFANVRPNSGASADVITSPATSYYELTVRFPDGRTIVDYFTAPDSAGTYQIADYLNSSPTAPTSLFTSYVQKAGDTMTGALTLSGAPSTNLHAATKAYADTMLPLAGGTMTGDLSLGTSKLTYTTLANDSTTRQLIRVPNTAAAEFRLVTNNGPVTGGAVTTYDHVMFFGWNITGGASQVDGTYGSVHLALESGYRTATGFDSAWHVQSESHISHAAPGDAANPRRVFSASYNWSTKQSDTGMHADYFSITEGGTGASNGSPTTARYVLLWDPTGVFTVNRKTVNITDQATSTPITAVQLNYGKNVAGSQAYFTMFSHSDGRGEVIWADDAAGTEYWRLGRNGSTDLKLRDHIASPQAFRMVFAGGNVDANSITAYGKLIARAESAQTVTTFAVTDSSGTAQWQFNPDGKLYIGSGSDTNLYRSAASVLKTDDHFIAVGGIDGGGA